jgi:peptidoglycan-associated lipoprotein
MKKLWFGFFLMAFVLFAFQGCSKKAKVEPPKEVAAVEKVDENSTKMDKEDLTEEEIFKRKSLEQLNNEGHLKRIHFDFDKYVIKEDMKSILNQNADWLMKHSSAIINVEGHCDERGTAEYNMALGEKRADAAKNYLVSLGVSGSRINTVSYGKGKPLVSGINEDTHYQNRRAEFKITDK